MKKTPLKIYSFPSMESCEGVTGIPKTTQQWAKSNGCTAFHSSNRVYLLPLLNWIFKEGAAGDAVNWGVVNEELNAKLKQIRIDVEMRELISKAEVQECLQAFSSITFGAIRRMSLEFPKELEMRPKEEIRAWTEKRYWEICDLARAEIDAFEQKTSPQSGDQHTSETPK